MAGRPLKITSQRSLLGEFWTNQRPRVRERETETETYSVNGQGGWRWKHWYWFYLWPIPKVFMQGVNNMWVYKRWKQDKSKHLLEHVHFFLISDLHPLCVHSKHREDSERSIFIRLKEGGYRLRENILFHLYVSTSPCGDARLNSPYEITTDCKKPHICLLSINNARPGSLWLTSVPGQLSPGILCVEWMDGSES